jgi:4-alpha-glucanotransferase
MSPCADCSPFFVSLARAAGILVHPTSLPGGIGIGDLGPGAELFLRWAAAGGQRVWQILPLGPTGVGNSPYSGLSAFAGNPLLISPERLIEDGLLEPAHLASAPAFDPRHVDYARMATWKLGILRRAWEAFKPLRRGRPGEGWEKFRSAPEQAHWLEDWALFAALKARHAGRAWYAWPRELVAREPGALERARRELSDLIDFEVFLQFLFFRQWVHLREVARGAGLLVMGDVPIYVGYDSAEVWARPELFDLDENGRPREVAGVPPDYFSKTGQLWGNPLYRWDRMEEDGFAWWIERIRANLRLADLIRIDHFRAFAAYWAVPAREKTAAGGRWVPGPGTKLFHALEQALGRLPIIAEDLGHITEDVRELRSELGFPGMRVLHFAFDDPDSDHLPEQFDACTVAFTGTHDNDTTRGWFDALSPAKQRTVRTRIAAEGDAIEWALIRALYRSRAGLVIVPVQDVLGLGSEARMNTPSRPLGNWEWRMLEQELRGDLTKRLLDLAAESDRVPALR